MSTWYEVRVGGHLDHHWAAVLGGDFALRHDADGSTALTGPVLDQAQLHGLLARLRDVGARLLSLRVLPEEPAATDGWFGAPP